MVMVRFSVWLASGYAHVLIQLSVVTVTPTEVDYTIRNRQQRYS